jgi:hypothetical protein
VRQSGEHELRSLDAARRESDDKISFWTRRNTSLQLAVDRLESALAADAGRGVFSRAAPPEGFVELTVAQTKEQLAPYASEVTSTQAALSRVAGVASALLQRSATPAPTRGGGGEERFDQEHEQLEQQRRPQQRPNVSASSFEQRIARAHTERVAEGEPARGRPDTAHPETALGARVVGLSSLPDAIYLNPDTLLPMIKQPEPPAPWYDVSYLWADGKEQGIGGRHSIQSGEIAL